MKYLMRSGALQKENGNVLCALQRVLFSTDKQVYNSDGSLALQIDIRQQQGPRGDVRTRAYRMRSPQGEEIALASPDYAPGEDPQITGWPVCRMPRVDHARVHMGEGDYMLTMQNSGCYILRDTKGEPVVKIIHRGMAGGWTIDESIHLSAQVLCGLFAFCRYLEGENEFLIV